MNTKPKDYIFESVITTRWNDNDSYEHVNNIIYYSFFDTVVNNFLINLVTNLTVLIFTAIQFIRNVHILSLYRILIMSWLV